MGLFTRTLKKGDEKVIFNRRKKELVIYDKTGRPKSGMRGEVAARKFRRLKNNK